VYHPFEIPAPDELARFHQIASQPLPDIPGGYILRASTDRGGDVELVVDPLGRSIRLRFSVLLHLVFDLFREGATRLRLAETYGSLVIAIEFEAGEIAGTLYINVGGTINIKDSLLLH